MVTLIIPPSPYLRDDKVFVSLGILYVAAALENKGVAVKVVDLKGRADWKEIIRASVDYNSQLIGITSTSTDFPIALQILDSIKSINSQVPVVIGGAHATVVPGQCQMFDKIVVGDGTTGIFLALENDKRIIHAQMQMDLDKLPLPARHLIDLSGYHYQIKGRRATNVMSQFGCPYSCIFCCGRNIPEYKRVRFRSPKNFIDELDMLNKEYGYSAFMIHDDEFNLDRTRTLEICRLLTKRNYIFRGFVRPDLFTKEIAEAMAKAGFFQVDAGVESGSEKILKIIRKRTTPEINTQARKLAASFGMKFKAFVTIGHPSESKEDILLTKKWLLENTPDAFEIYMLTPYPGAPIFDNKEDFDIEFSVDFTKDNTSLTRQYGEYNCLVRNSFLGYKELALLREQIDKEVRGVLGLTPAN